MIFYAEIRGSAKAGFLLGNAPERNEINVNLLTILLAKIANLNFGPKRPQSRDFQKSGNTAARW